jgi:hypothetical protein
VRPPPRLLFGLLRCIAPSGSLCHAAEAAATANVAATAAEAAAATGALAAGTAAHPRSWRLCRGRRMGSWSMRKPVMTTETKPTTLIAYRVSESPAMRLVRAPVAREWMTATRERFAHRCLPLLIANEAGWLICSGSALRATWDGGDDISSLTVEPLHGPAPVPALSHFGHGILTWHIPYLFRTAPGYNLVVRGPTNRPKDGACPLDGVVETDWAAATFTMNWKLTHAGMPVTFEVDEPICMIFPQRRGELEDFRPEVRALDADVDVSQGHRRWRESRAAFLVDLDAPGAPPEWQKHYFRGTTPDGNPGTGHQTKLKLHDFVHRDEDAAGPPPAGERLAEQRDFTPFPGSD